MVKVTTIGDTKVLVPNNAHKNFVESDEVIPQGTELTGDVREIEGLRRGQPFKYKLFYTDNNKIIYLKKIKMENTETTMGADSAQTPTVVTIPTQSRLAKASSIGAMAGLVIGFGYAKYKKHEHKKITLYTVVGGLIGFVIGEVIENTKKTSVVASK